MIFSRHAFFRFTGSLGGSFGNTTYEIPCDSVIDYPLSARRERYRSPSNFRARIYYSVRGVSSLFLLRWAHERRGLTSTSI
jgi:hypothetical protein